MSKYIIEAGIENPYKEEGDSFYQVGFVVTEESRVHADRIIVYGTEESSVELRDYLLDAIKTHEAGSEEKIALQQLLALASPALLDAIWQQKEHCEAKRAEAEAAVAKARAEQAALAQLHMYLLSHTPHKLETP